MVIGGDVAVCRYPAQAVGEERTAAARVANAYGYAGLPEQTTGVRKELVGLDGSIVSNRADLSQCPRTVSQVAAHLTPQAFRTSRKAPVVDYVEPPDARKAFDSGPVPRPAEESDLYFRQMGLQGPN